MALNSFLHTDFVFSNINGHCSFALKFVQYAFKVLSQAKGKFGTTIAYFFKHKLVDLVNAGYFLVCLDFF